METLTGVHDQTKAQKKAKFHDLGIYWQKFFIKKYSIHECTYTLFDCLAQFEHRVEYVGKIALINNVPELHPQIN